MRRTSLLLSFLVFTAPLFSQKALKKITSAEASRIESVLSADSLQGRKTGTAGIEKAADFISNEFAAAGLQTFAGATGYRQVFTMVKPKQTSVSAKLDTETVEEKNIAVITSTADLKVNASSGFKKIQIKAGDNLFREAQKILGAKENTVVFVDTSFGKLFPNLQRVKRNIFQTPYSYVFILTQQNPKAFEVAATHQFEEQQLSNIVSVLPGKSRKDEYVIFSGHYDHLGIGKPVDGDSIYNGANDDAAGITAVILLAKYYKKLRKNDRTIIFAAFTAEETGGFGSQYFSRQLDPAKVMAMFNIEMIGTESKWGKNSAYITGYEKSDMGKILEKNLEGSAFKFYADPYTDQQLFYRSDNATLARLGVPAHTISTSKMDSEPNYHKVSDDLKTLDMTNMAEIIKAVATSAKSIVSGKDTPSRVNTADLK
ncbi:MAG: M20/M25/M40 family metallo-hydrolase [Ferruginibacter sp.]|nr:M20/M25/M40 family metallo-hydrolase [Ferruginibacter sp.]